MFELVGQTKEGKPSRQRDVIDEGHSEIQGKLISSGVNFRLLRQLHAPILNLASEPQAWVSCLNLQEGCEMVHAEMVHAVTQQKWQPSWDEAKPSWTSDNQTLRYAAKASQSCSLSSVTSVPYKAKEQNFYRLTFNWHQKLAIQHETLQVFWIGERQGSCIMPQPTKRKNVRLSIPVMQLKLQLTARQLRQQPFLLQRFFRMPNSESALGQSRRACLKQNDRNGWKPYTANC